LKSEALAEAGISTSTAHRPAQRSIDAHHDPPHRPTAGTIDGGHQLDLPRPAAAAVVAHPGEDVVDLRLLVVCPNPRGYP
jgi:queuine/archaeosine tRNA-ribosyltransferase